MIVSEGGIPVLKRLLFLTVLLLPLLLCGCQRDPEMIEVNGQIYRLLKEDVHALECGERLDAESGPFWRVSTELFDMITPQYRSDILYVREDEWQAAHDYLTNPESFRSICIVGNIFDDDVAERTYDLPSMDGDLFASLKRFDDANRRIPLSQLEHPDAQFLAMHNCVETTDYELTFRRISRDGGFVLPVCTGYLPLEGRIVRIFVHDGGRLRGVEGVEIVELEPTLLEDIMRVLKQDGIPYCDAPDDIFIPQA